MRKFKKIISLSLVFAALVCTFSAKAEKIDFTEALVEQIKVSVSKSGCVVTKRARTRSRKSAGLNLCEKRFKLLSDILNMKISPSEVKHVIGNYLRDAQVPSTSPEAVRLRRTVTVEDLRHNVGVILEVYNRLK